MEYSKELEEAIKKLIEMDYTNNIFSLHDNPLYNKSILAIGDSFVKGHSLPDEKTWLSILAERNKMIKYNYGVNGASVAKDSNQKIISIVEYIDCVINNISAVDYIVFLAGHNDANPDLHGGMPIPIGKNNDNLDTTFKGG